MGYDAHSWVLAQNLLKLGYVEMISVFMCNENAI